jgi:hypothetical protein
MSGAQSAGGHGKGAANPPTFGLRTPEDLIAKLERELARLGAARKPADMIDHGLNFAISAWHMAEWIAKNDTCREALRVNLQTTDTDAQGLRKKLEKLALSKCPELECCRVIASSAKHLQCTRPPPRDPTFMANEAPAEVGWVNNRNESITFCNNEGNLITWMSSLCTVHEGNRRQATEIFEQVLAWWRSFVVQLKVKPSEFTC